MPKVYQSSNGLKKNIVKNILLIFGLWFITFMIILFMGFLSILSYFGIFLLAFASLITHFLGRNLRVTLNGLTGERKALRALKKVSRKYSVFSNMVINYDGKESETDMIIVGQKGIFLIEVKNHRGEIKGDENDREWIQTKKTQKGGIYHNPFYSPVKQVKTHVYRLSSLLKQHGYHGWVQGVVYFSHPDAVVKTTTNSIPIISNEEGIYSFIENFEPINPPTEKELKKIKQVLKDQLRK